MNINIQYIVKFWDYLRKLFKPEREGVLLSRKDTELPEYSVAKNALENNIAHATSVDFISQYAFDEGSTNVRDNLGTGTGLIWKSFGSSSTAVRQVPEGQSKRSRTAPEQDSKECRTRVEAQSNNTRTGVKQKILGRVNPDFFLTNLTPTSNFLRLGFGSASGFHRLQCMKSRSTVEQNLSGSRKRGEKREEKVYQEKDGATTVQVCCSYGETYYKGKRRLKESPNKIRTNGFAFFMVFMKNVLAKIVLDIRLAYGLFTNALLKRYQKGTADVLESYQRASEVSSLAVLGMACARQVRGYGCSCVAQASVMRMLSTGNAWIVRKTVPVYALLTHYQRIIYASSILNPYTESSLSQIRGFKRSNFFCRASEWFCINNKSNRLKCFSNQAQGGVSDVVNEGFVKLSLKSRFSAVMILLLIVTFGSVSAQAQNKQNYVLQGTVISAVDKKPLQAVSVRVEADNVKTSTKKDGSFNIAVSQRTGKVKFTSVGYKTLELDYTSGAVLSVQLYAIENQLDEVEVVSTGFQKIPKERATGSFEFVDNKQLNKRVGSSIIDRLENMSNSLRIDKEFKWLDRAQYQSVPNYSFEMRGKSALLGAPSRTIILDNVVYEGDLRDINPNDIESVSILKDAIATSLWGIYGGGGVIVLTTKKGSLNSATKLSFNSNLTIQKKPDIYALPFMNSKDFIEYETFLFDKGYFNSRLNDTYSYTTVSPVVKLLDEMRKGNLSSAEAKTQMDLYSTYDIRDDYYKYVYRNAINQQYALNLSGGSNKISYSFSAGYDKNINNKISSDNERTTLRSFIKVSPLSKLDIVADINFTNVNARDASIDQSIAYGALDAGAGGLAWPYLRLVDASGKPIPNDAVPVNKAFRDTAGNGKLQDWTYNLLNEVDGNSQILKSKNLMATISMAYQFKPDLNVQLIYNYQYNPVKVSDWLGLKSFKMRNLINYYSQWNDVELLKTPIPVGDRLSLSNTGNQTQMGRVQINYSPVFKDGIHRVDFLGAAEVREKQFERDVNTQFGYDPTNLNFIPIDAVSIFPYLNQKFGGGAISTADAFEKTINRYVSFLANANYSYLNRYNLSANIRKDASNLFGAKTNQKWQPLWSIGAAWEINKESFLNSKDINLLKLRGSFGFSGHANAEYAAQSIIYYNGTIPLTNLPYANITSPANPSLSWEKIRTINLGLDYSFFGNRLMGSVEWYKRNSQDLMSTVLIDPTIGFESTIKNGGELEGKGWELEINSSNIETRLFKWKTKLLVNRNRTRVQKYDYKFAFPYNYVMTSGSTSSQYRKGYDVGTVFAYRSAGLDPETGDPRGYLDGEISKNYRGIMYGGMENILDVGSGVPRYYGSLGNEFTVGNFSMTFNIQARWGFKFFRQSFNQQTAAENRVGYGDYNQRWQKPGDEMYTNVPSLNYPIDIFRGRFNSGTTDWVEDGANIRLQDILISYRVGRLKYIKDLSIYGFVKNMNVMLWRKNNVGIDPEYRDAIPFPLSVSFGVNMSL
ncbi:SusC/RagA family TonB-linked outer membrane protein [Sphingobacterium sp. JUb56]|uniref:SusC/RagA family TonB-linked outer membrane protein n=1 Tax=Sphingobacterium sp. JUb56 TaxID=2587145 RepID=UPI00161CA100|nr:SusC/RagA family TonB-linked outer membrane protein [Sphingobacterium sp. JUb56]MBB2950178.1 TonB-linked SusC/RagA family outer membrane protein [Sphingobacterium sp. JUb56]